MPRDPGEPPMIQCKSCGRAVWSNHVDSKGLCSLCQRPDDASAKPEEPATA